MVQDYYEAKNVTLPGKPLTNLKALKHKLMTRLMTVKDDVDKNRQLG